LATADTVKLDELLPGQGRPEVRVQIANQRHGPPLEVLREPTVARLATSLRHQPTGAVALVGVAESTDLASGDAENLGCLPPFETPLKHPANDLETIYFLRAHRYQLLGQHARERAV